MQNLSILTQSPKKTITVWYRRPCGRDKSGYYWKVEEKSVQARELLLEGREASHTSQEQATRPSYHHLVHIKDFKDKVYSTGRVKDKVNRFI